MGAEMQYIETIYHHFDDLVLSFFLVLIIVWICDAARELLFYLSGGQKINDSVSHITILEMIGTMEATVICFEINFIIYDLFGVIMYTLAMFIWMIWQAKRPPENHYTANPLNLVVKHIESYGNNGKKEKGKGHDLNSNTEKGQSSVYGRFDYMMLIMWAQCVGAYLAYNFILYAAWNNAKYWTMWKDTNYHVTRHRTASEWNSAMSDGPVTAAIVEGIFSCAQYLLPLYVKFRKLSGNSADIVSDLGKAIFAGIGTPLSGGYYNPVLASALEFYTIGYSNYTKAFVYWVVPFAGTFLAMILESI